MKGDYNSNRPKSKIITLISLMTFKYVEQYHVVLNFPQLKMLLKIQNFFEYMKKVTSISEKDIVQYSSCNRPDVVGRLQL